MPWLLKVGRGLPSVYDYDKRWAVVEQEQRRVGIMINRPGNIKIRKRKLERTKVDERVEGFQKGERPPQVIVVLKWWK